MVKCTFVWYFLIGRRCKIFAHWICIFNVIGWYRMVSFQLITELSVPLNTIRLAPVALAILQQMEFQPMTVSEIFHCLDSLWTKMAVAKGLGKSRPLANFGGNVKSRLTKILDLFMVSNKFILLYKILPAFF